MIIKLSEIGGFDRGTGDIFHPGGQLVAINSEHVISIRQEFEQETPPAMGNSGKIIYAVLSMTHGEEIRIRVGLWENIPGSTETPVWLSDLLNALNK